MHQFKSAILAIFQFWQIGTFELVHGIQFFFDQKTSFRAFYKCTEIMKLSPTFILVFSLHLSIFLQDSTLLHQCL